MGTGQAHACKPTLLAWLRLITLHPNNKRKSASRKKEKKGGKEEEQTCTTKLVQK